ncbi:sugar O-acyltransferase, sialic acid O-acetyltransferase NeuD family [Cyclobacterium lianum]|uniref:Sugar O-acyltransferase, sialic acid O-acetyltransferase NeuD family n=1 Tax=Cyclobacterium lianum TaxID=388280 RepID=A0A1M7NDT2_9BACT|nr:NeuD/PglB/VioB family sugar acetyltransferase [Cyclobacterium lianum]SHN01816.1 sugar O-acyltransferase, sialic acid O-acetyltransferase NeuD family [Cyclobacterium lianum]
MSEAKKVFLFGYSGHAYVIIESLLDAGYKVAGYFDKKEAASNPYQLPYFGFEKEVNVRNIVGDQLVFPAVGDNSIRKVLVYFFNSLNLKQFVLKDPSANISKTASIGVSTYVGKAVLINAQSKIGEGVILNTGSIVEHECELANFVHIAPGAVLCGNVKIGNESLIGSNSVITENKSVVGGALIGAGTVVTKNVMENGIWFGNPVRKK